MITLQRLLSELKAESLNEIVAGYGSTPPPVCNGSDKSSKSGKKRRKSSHKVKKCKPPKKGRC
jgi:hypothetical protein